MKVIIVCDSASLKMGGEAAIPIRFFRCFIYLGVETKLLVHSRVKNELEETFSDEEIENTMFFEDRPSQKIIHIIGSLFSDRIREMFFYNLISILTEMSQVKYIRNENYEAGSTIVFKPTPISPKSISIMKFREFPVFFGVLNGAMTYPPGLAHKSSRISEMAVVAGRWLSEPLHYVVSAKASAAGLFVANPRSLEALPKATRRCRKYKSFDATIDGKHWGRVEHVEAPVSDHFVFVGRLVDWKAVELAIAAAHALDGRARLTIVGDGPERMRLETLAASGPADITFTGYLAHEGLLEIYSTATALLLPSLREAGGNVCMEALAAGVPVIATRWGGAQDVVIDGVDGFLIPPQDERTLILGFAEAMRNMMDDPDLARRMGNRGRSRVLKAFDWEMKARDYLEIFKATLARDDREGSPRGTVIDAHPAHAEDRMVNPAWSHYPPDA